MAQWRYTVRWAMRLCCGYVAGADIFLHDKSLVGVLCYMRGDCRRLRAGSILVRSIPISGGNPVVTLA